MRAALPHVTVAVGNLEECEVAVAERDPLRGRAGPARTRGRAGGRQAGAARACWRWTRDGVVEVPPVPVEVVNGLGAGDAFGGALCHGLLAGWDTRAPSCASPTPPAPSSPSRLECSDGDADGRRGARTLLARRRAMLSTDRLAAGHPRPACAAPEQAIAEAAAQRRSARRRCSAPDGRLMIVAADHPARGALRRRRPAAGHGRPRRPAGAARASRWRGPGVDGVLGTADILEDLLLLGALEGKVVIGSMNRGGLPGTRLRAGRPVHRLRRARRSRGCGSTAARCCSASTPTTRRRSATLEACAQAVTDLAGHRLMAMVEPFIVPPRGRPGPQRPVARRGDQVRHDRLGPGHARRPTPG